VCGARGLALNHTRQDVQMKKMWIRRVIVAVFMLVVLSGGLAAVVSWAAPAAPWCKVSRDTVASLSASDLPRNLREFVEIPRRYRLAVVKVSPASAVATIMREAVQEAIDSSRFNEQQRDLLVRALPHITAEMYENSVIYNKATAKDKTLVRTDQDALALIAIAREAEVLFTREEWNRFVSPMGRPQTVPGVAWLLPTARQLLNGVVQTVSASSGDCNCNPEGPSVSGWNCPDDTGCYVNIEGDTVCEESSFGCGAFWLSECVGICVNLEDGR
jgi:hypothetical protein